ncbi:MAG: nucleotidyl transferase AbiEii/AbiGii toxin family protein [Chromatiales bacterium]|nr:nucleotidyl transferase AbiEii/AbiGii toxin family protein [Chromatiales bacterium]
MSISLDVSGRIDRGTVELLRTVDRLMQQLAIPYVVIGATARDMVLHYGYGADVERATQDVDFAIEVPNWAAFDALKQKLAETGFELTREQHRLKSSSGAVVDIVPFGEVEKEKGSIAWPPKGDVVISVLGFQEVSDNADRVRVDNEPELIVPVATPAGMALLKLIAWFDRVREKRVKDAQDLSYLLDSYERIPAVKDALYSEAWTPIMERYGWDLTRAAARMLGHDAATIARKKTRTEILALMSAGNKLEQLVAEMCTGNSAHQYEHYKRLLSAFAEGFEAFQKARNWGSH